MTAAGAHLASIERRESYARHRECDGTHRQTHEGTARPVRLGQSLRAVFPSRGVTAVSNSPLHDDETPSNEGVGLAQSQPDRSPADNPPSSINKPVTSDATDEASVGTSSSRRTQRSNDDSLTDRGGPTSTLRGPQHRHRIQSPVGGGHVLHRPRSEHGEKELGKNSDDGLRALSSRPLQIRRGSRERTHVVPPPHHASAQKQRMPPSAASAPTTSPINTRRSSIGGGPREDIGPSESRSIERDGGGGRSGGQGSFPLPKGMTGELMRRVAALDVTRMSCEQVSYGSQQSAADGSCRR